MDCAVYSIGCRRFVCAEAIATLISKSTTSVSPSQDEVLSSLIAAAEKVCDDTKSPKVPTSICLRRKSG